MKKTRPKINLRSHISLYEKLHKSKKFYQTQSSMLSQTNQTHILKSHPQLQNLKP